MLRIVFSGLMLLALTAFPAQAQGKTFHDIEGRFTVAVPEGWRAEQEDIIQFALVMRRDKTACIVSVNTSPESRNTTQADLDSQYVGMFDTNFWMQSFQAAGLSEIKIEDLGTVQRDGRNAYYIVATMGRSSGTDMIRVKARQEVHVIPGSLQMIACTAREEAYGDAKADIDTILASYQPKSGEYIVRAPDSIPTVLNLFAASALTGRVTADAARLQGFANAASVTGPGAWQVCDQQNFVGNCRIVTGIETGEPATMRPILSARRVYGQGPRQALPEKVLAGSAAITARSTSLSSK